AGHQRLLDAFVGEPLLYGLRTQAATETVQVTVGMLLAPLHPGAGAFGAHSAANQLVAELNGGLLALFLVTDADAMTFVIVEQRQVAGQRESAACELDRRAHVEQRHVIKKQAGVVATVVTHAGHSTQSFEALLSFASLRARRSAFGIHWPVPRKISNICCSARWLRASTSSSSS